VQYLGGLQAGEVRFSPQISLMTTAIPKEPKFLDPELAYIGIKKTPAGVFFDSS
jgi:hypothetical protein